MNSLLIIGAGTFASQIEEIASLVGFNKISYLDDNPASAVCFPVLGDTSELYKFTNDYTYAIVAVGNNENRKRLTKLLEESNYDIPILIHPTAYVSPDAILSPGCIIREMCVVGRYAELGKSTILNIGAKVDHHCIIGAYSHLLINSVVRASKKVEPLSWIDANQVIQ